jgi:hypothetical protein
MVKIKIGRNDIISIAKEKYKLSGEVPKDRINYEKWVDFIDTHKDYFLWYEDTEDGKNTLINIDNIPNWAKNGVLQRLSKTNAYSTNKIVKHQFDFVVRYFSTEGIVKIDIEKKMTKEIAIVLFEMAKFLDGKLIINGTKELENIEQLS